jgi:hypothetical protein
MNNQDYHTVLTRLSTECLKVLESAAVNFTIGLETYCGQTIWITNGGKLKQDLLIGSLKQEEEDLVFTYTTVENQTDFKSLLEMGAVQSQHDTFEYASDFTTDASDSTFNFDTSSDIYFDSSSFTASDTTYEDDKSQTEEHDLFVTASDFTFTENLETAGAYVLCGLWRSSSYGLSYFITLRSADVQLLASLMAQGLAT